MIIIWDIGGEFQSLSVGYAHIWTSAWTSLYIPTIRGISTFTNLRTIVAATKRDMSGWVSPTGHVDPDSKWIRATYAYDDNLGNETYGVEGYYLELTHAALSCDKVRFYYLSGINYNAIDVDIDVYYSATWHNIHSGNAGGSEDWFEFAIGSTQSVTACRIKSNIGEDSCYFNECDFRRLPTLRTIIATTKRTISSFTNFRRIIK